MSCGLPTRICSLLCTSFGALRLWAVFLDHLCASEGIHFTPETKVVVFLNSLCVTSWLILIPFSPVSCPTLHFLPLSFCCFLWSRWRVPSVYRQPLCFTHIHSLSSFCVSLQPLCLFAYLGWAQCSVCTAAVLHSLLNQLHSASGDESYSLFSSSSNQTKPNPVKSQLHSFPFKGKNMSRWCQNLHSKNNLYLFWSVGTLLMHHFLCLITNESQILSGWKEA